MVVMGVYRSRGQRRTHPTVLHRKKKFKVTNHSIMHLLLPLLPEAILTIAKKNFFVSHVTKFSFYTTRMPINFTRTSHIWTTKQLPNKHFQSTAKRNTTWSVCVLCVRITQTKPHILTKRHYINYWINSSLASKSKFVQQQYIFMHIGIWLSNIWKQFSTTYHFRWYARLEHRRWNSKWNNWIEIKW